MLERKAFRQLLAWKERPSRKCLVVQGARQVGKTFAVEEFGRRHFAETITLNFKETPSAAAIFDGDLDVDRMVRALRFRFPSAKMEPGETLLFFDEIQECAEAVTALKFWSLDGRYDVVASGSMLGIDYKRASSYPVGYVDYIRMFGLDFEEYLWAIGIAPDLVAYLKDCLEQRSAVPADINRQAMQHFRSYCALGGMPEVVQTFIDTGDFMEADRVQRAILQGYLYDIAHYATASEKIKAEQCFLSLTGQLLDKENHKFQYKAVEPGGKGQKFLSSIEWLERADIVRTSKNVTHVAFDLADYEIAGNFRAYTTDLSLLVAMRDFSFKQGIVENSLEGNTKGGLFECAVADCLIKGGHSLHFYRNESSKREVDFIIQGRGEVVPIEVKAGSSKARSLNRVMEGNSRITLGYKLIDGNVGTAESGIVTAPLYMAAFIAE